LNYICANFDKFAPQASRLTKELKDKLWKFAVMEHLIDDERLPLFFDTYSTREIDLSGCDRVTDNSLSYISKKFSTTQIKVNLAFCNNITQEGIKILAQNCSSINTLSLHHCAIGDPALLHISTYLQTLKSLSLTGCLNISDNGVTKIAQKCQELQYLDISHCKTLTSGSVKAIASSLSNLTHLDLSWCSDSISEGSLQKLSKIHKLLYLGVADSKITDHVLHKIMQSCSKLTSLDISFCNSVLQSEKHLKYLANLTRLNVAGCSVGEPILTKILETAVELRDLDISYNDQVKEGWVTTSLITTATAPTTVPAAGIITATTPTLAKQLKTINISFCKNISVKVAQLLQQARDNTTVFYFAV